MGEACIMCNSDYLQKIEEDEQFNTNGFVGKPWGNNGKLFSLGRENMDLFIGENFHNSDPADLLEMKDYDDVEDEGLQDLLTDEHISGMSGVYSEESVEGMRIISQMLDEIEEQARDFDYEVYEAQLRAHEQCCFDHLDDEKSPIWQAKTPRVRYRDNNQYGLRIHNRNCHVYQAGPSLKGQWVCDGNINALNERGIDSHGKWGRKKPNRRSAKGRRWEARATHRHQFGF